MELCVDISLLGGISGISVINLHVVNAKRKNFAEDNITKVQVGNCYVGEYPTFIEKQNF